MCLQQEFTDLLTKLHETIKEVRHLTCSLVHSCSTLAENEATVPDPLERRILNS